MRVKSDYQHIKDHPLLFYRKHYLPFETRCPTCYAGIIVDSLDDLQFEFTDNRKQQMYVSCPICHTHIIRDFDMIEEPMIRTILFRALSNFYYSDQTEFTVVHGWVFWAVPVGILLIMVVSFFLAAVYQPG